MLSLPFAQWNLRRNPFGEPPPEDRAALYVGGVQDWPQFLMGGGGHSPRFLQFLGPSGCGKTSRLRALLEYFPDSPRLAWCPVEGWPPLPSSEEGPLFVDDAQELNGWLLARVLRLSAVAAATQHDLTDRFARAGFTLRTVKVQESVTLELIQEFARRRLEWARRGPGAVPWIQRDVLPALLRRHGPDLQSIQFDLYDHYQKLGVEA